MNRDWPAPDDIPTAAQLELTFRVLDEVGELRREVDTLRASVGSRRLHSVPALVFRVAAESAVLVAVAVVCGSGHLRPALTIALMAVTLLAVTVSEALASRSAVVPRGFGFAQARPLVLDPPPEVALESAAWGRDRLETEPTSP